MRAPSRLRRIGGFPTNTPCRAEHRRYAHLHVRLGHGGVLTRPWDLDSELSVPKAPFCIVSARTGPQGHTADGTVEAPRGDTASVSCGIETGSTAAGSVALPEVLGVEKVVTAARSPWQNAYAEAHRLASAKVPGSCRRPRRDPPPPDPGWVPRLQQPGAMPQRRARGGDRSAQSRRGPHLGGGRGARRSTRHDGIRGWHIRRGAKRPRIRRSWSRPVSPLEAPAQHGPDSDLPRPVRLVGDQAFPARDRALERHGESDGSMGGAATPRGVPVRRDRARRAVPAI